MAKLGTITLTGQSGLSYDFNVYPWGTEFNDFGAVYYISNRHKDGDTWSHTKIYIGQSGDMSERFDDHHKADCFEDHNANAISVHQDDNKTSRTEKESDLIAALDPPCNG